MSESLESSVAESMQVETSPDEEKNPDPEEASDNDSGSVSSTETDNSDSDDIDTSETAKDPELLLIKATSLKEEGNSYFKSQDYDKALR